MLLFTNRLCVCRVFVCLAFVVVLLAANVFFANAERGNSVCRSCGNDKSVAKISSDFATKQTKAYVCKTSGIERILTKQELKNDRIDSSAVVNAIHADKCTFKRLGDGAKDAAQTSCNASFSSKADVKANASDGKKSVKSAGANSAAKTKGGWTCSAKGAIVAEQSTGRVVFEQNADARLPMASTTKIATALTVLRHANVNGIVTVPKAACGIEGSSVYLTEGERLSVLDLLYGLMLRSGNDCAVALALHVGGSVDGFVEMMNRTAQSVGCENTHFVNPHGLHDENHYTSARDLAKITCEAFKNPLFCQIVAAKTYRVQTDGANRVFVNKNKLLSRYDYADGVKTGFTKKAGRCFVGSASQNGMRFVSVLLNCAPMFEESQALLQHAFCVYSACPVAFVNQVAGSVLRDGQRRYLYCPVKLVVPVKVGEVVEKSVEAVGDDLFLCVKADAKPVAKIKLAFSPTE